MTVYCPACEQALGSRDELCHHPKPVGYCCCDDEHPIGYHSDEFGDVA